MKSQTLILLIVAAGCGLVAMLGVQQVLNNKDGQETPTVNVLQAAADITIGLPLDEVNTQWVSVDPESVPEGAVTDLEQIKDRSLLMPVNIGDWITEKKLSEKGARGLVVNIPDGMQVCTIPVDPTTSHSGMLQAGHRVDLMINYQARNEVGDLIQKVKRILQYVEVFAVDDKVYGLNNDEGQSGKAKNISLLVTPEQVMFLELAKTRGRMSTVLRRNGDDVEVAANELSEEEMDGSKSPGIDTTTSSDANRNIEQESADSMLNELQGVFGELETGPVIAAELIEEETWQIAIWEGTEARVDTVYLNSDLPIRDTTNKPTPAMTPQETLQMPVPPDAEASGTLGGLEIFEALKEAASDLWSPDED
jgi:pilus assembly protein CpaB